MLIEFRVQKEILTDKSEVFDLWVDGDSCGCTAWNAPSECSADTSATVLNEVLEGFTLCGSDRDVKRLAAEIRAAIAKVLD